MTEPAAGLEDVLLGGRRLREYPVSALPAHLLARWCDRATAGDADVFRAQRRWDGPAPTAASSDTIRAVHECALSGAGAPGQIAGDPIPFEEVLAPAVTVASQRLDALVGYSVRRLRPAARHALERCLLRRLSLHATPALATEFDAARPPGERMALRWLGARDRGDAAYRAFVRCTLADGLLGFFHRYPALARAIATMVDVWAESSAEALGRLSRYIGETDPLACDGVVTSLVAGHSDPHARGRTVMLFSLASGVNLVYKPRDVSAEAAFHSFITWCNEMRAPIDLAAPRVDCRSGYGWVERVEQKPLCDAAAARRYYRRAGALLAVIHLLGGTDAHHENIIASGEYPVFVDAETLLTPETAPGTQPSDTPAAARLARSVLRTGMLPGRIGDAKAGLSYDVSVLGDLGGALPSVPRWRDINTDAMRMAPEPAKLTTEHLPVLDGQPVTARAYRADVVEGFREMSCWMVAQKAELLADDGPLQAFRGIVARFVFRPTAVYGLVLHSSLRPERLASGVERSIELEVLARIFAGAEECPKAWPILAAEREALEDLDVPLFSMRTDSTQLDLGPDGPSIPSFFRTSAFDELMARASRLDTKKVDEETRIIEAAFAASAPAGAPATSEAAPVACTAERLLAEAETIARTLAQHAVRAHDGAVAWYGLALAPNGSHFTVQAAGPGLYDGVCGPALFLAAMDKVRGTAEYRDLVVGAVRTAVRGVETHAAALPIGGATGLGSVVYTLARLAGFLRMPGLIDAARLVAARITPERIAADRELDVLSGAAGAVLGLLALFDATDERSVLRTAEAAGLRLCTRPGPTLTGMSHGAAGIAYALLRLYAATGERRYFDAAAGAIAWEDSLFLHEESNWPDLRASAAAHSGHRTSWCHGAPGIGLARLGGLAYFDRPIVHRDIAAAIETTRAACYGPVDHLCCGLFGRAETLLVAASVLDRPELRREALGHAGRALARGLYVGHDAPAFAPGFFRGLAGIGYQLLRLASPDAIPSVLLWS